MLTLLLVPSLKQGDAEVVSAPPPRPLVPRDSLRIITPELIEDLGLTIDWGLQEYIANTLERYQVGFAAVTVLDPRTGEILALYGRDSSGEDCRLGLNAYLAASLFKLVTATAAIDYAGMSADTRVPTPAGRTRSTVASSSRRTGAGSGRSAWRAPSPHRTTWCSASSGPASSGWSRCYSRL